MRTILAGLALTLIAAPAAAQSVQQRFDAAVAKLEAQDAAGALAELDALEAYLLAQAEPNQTNLAITRAMKGEALLRAGRVEEGRAAVDAALAGDWLAKPALAPMRDKALLLRANILEATLDHAEADRLFLEVAATTTAPMTRAVALLGAARNEMFVDADGALRRVNEALAIAEQDESVGKAQLANVLGLKGRILLNGGQDAEARTLLVRAVGLRGGLTLRTDLADAALRADAGIALLRVGQDELARKYLAYSGAGHSKTQLDPPADTPLPGCGEDGDLRPEDMAVIEFTLLDDGRVVAPRPIFASRQGEMAYMFARAVADWSWEPADAAKVNLFYRAALRVEMRCSRQAERPSLISGFESRAREWLASAGAAVASDGPAVERAQRARRELAALPAGDRGARRLALVAALAANPVVPKERQRDHADEALALAQALRAPPEALLVFALLQADKQIASGLSARARGLRMAEALESLRAWPAFADARIQGTIRTMIADHLMRARRNAEAIAMLRPVAANPALPEYDPLKVAALIALANAHAAEKDLAAATEAYRRTGLTAEQCALLDNGPAPTKGGFGRYPTEILEWGFDGWTTLEFDVAADGRTRRARTVVAFPPALFNAASEAIADTVRYAPSYRPESDLACTAMRRRVKFSNGL